MNKAQLWRFIIVAIILFISFTVVDILLDSSTNYIKNIWLIIVVIIVAIVNRIFLNKKNRD